MSSTISSAYANHEAAYTQTEVKAPMAKKNHEPKKANTFNIRDTYPGKEFDKSSRQRIAVHISGVLSISRQSIRVNASN